MRRLLLLPPLLLALAAAKDTGLGREKYLPDPGAPTATLRLDKGNVRLSIKRGDTQYYGVMAGDTCKAARKLTIYTAGIGGNTTERTLPITAGAPLRILATLQKQANGGYATELFSTCSRTGRFTPQPGHAYRLTQDAAADSPSLCELTVADEASGAAPADLETAPIAACRF